MFYHLFRFFIFLNVHTFMELNSLNGFYFLFLFFKKKNVQLIRHCTFGFSFL